VVSVPSTHGCSASSALIRPPDHPAPPVVRVVLPLDEPALLERGDHARHRLVGDEGVAGQFGGGQVLPPLQHGQRRVLQGGQRGGLEHLVEAGAHRQLQLLDQVEQAGRRGLVRQGHGEHGD
jgi:hypothetical protein